ncbi:MAG: carboxymuconolactone decarboxylase family protein [Spirochaetales bacterium]|nr:carboxymuconolactone decarboxylase family protein [Spirochaetales bacterium]
MKKESLRTFDSLSEYWSLFQKTFKKMSGLRKILRREQITPQFREKLMLVVSQTNQCAYCSFLHAKKALEEGISQNTIDNILDIEEGHFTPKEIPAVLFARHFAETKGNVSPLSIHTLTEYYGEHTSRQIQAFLQSVLFGNLCCNTVFSFKEHLFSASEKRNRRLAWLCSLPVASMIKKNSLKN